MHLSDHNLWWIQGGVEPSLKNFYIHHLAAIYVRNIGTELILKYIVHKIDKWLQHIIFKMFTGFARVIGGVNCTHIGVTSRKCRCRAVERHNRIVTINFRILVGKLTWSKIFKSLDFCPSAITPIHSTSAVNKKQLQFVYHILETYINPWSLAVQVP